MNGMLQYIITLGYHEQLMAFGKKYYSSFKFQLNSVWHKGRRTSTRWVPFTSTCHAVWIRLWKQFANPYLQKHIVSVQTINVKIMLSFSLCDSKCSGQKMGIITFLACFSLIVLQTERYFQKIVCLCWKIREQWTVWKVQIWTKSWVIYYMNENKSMPSTGICKKLHVSIIIENCDGILSTHVQNRDLHIMRYICFLFLPLSNYTSNPNLKPRR